HCDASPRLPSPNADAQLAQQALSRIISIPNSASSVANKSSVDASFAPNKDPPPPTEPSTRRSKRKSCEKAFSKKNAKKQRETQVCYAANPALVEKHLEAAEPLQTVYSSGNMPIASTGWITKRAPPQPKKMSSTFRLDDLVGPDSRFDFDLQPWSGLCVTSFNNRLRMLTALLAWVHRPSTPILDDERRVMGVCAGMPRNDENWNSVQHRAAALLEDARVRLIFGKKEQNGRRGKFPAINIGISHGGGQPYPKMLQQASVNIPTLQTLMNDWSFQRISGFATGAFATWAPRLYAYQNDCLTDLIEHDRVLRQNNAHPSPEDEPLRRNWPKTPWAAAALNFGPQTICNKHADYGNLAFGWCCITALGDYDYRKGGHLVLWDLKRVIEFPPGATILIPSSAIYHSNTIIQPDERRYSFTQYSAGGIFRWRDNGYKTVAQSRSTMAPEEISSLLSQLSTQLSFGLSLYSSADEIESPR
ncbi:hypothetical protein CVT26_002549, partial [Gymnopilus dilepis]